MLARFEPTANRALREADAAARFERTFNGGSDIRADLISAPSLEKSHRLIALWQPSVARLDSDGQRRFLHAYCTFQPSRKLSA
jgi:hypothetical protein